MLVLYIQVREPVSGQTRQQEFSFDPAAITPAMMDEVRKLLQSWAAEFPAVKGPPPLSDLGKLNLTV